ncbi:hypothetical protein ACFE04_012343 [Oxalis oulophora]
MAENGRVHPDCVNAPNPYHECGVACLERISEGKGRKDKKKSEKHSVENGIGERNVHPACNKASNPYHECNDNCYKTVNTPGIQKQSGTKLLNLSGSFGRKKKEAEAKAASPRTPVNGYGFSAAIPARTQSPRPNVPTKKDNSSENSRSKSFSSSEPYSEEMNSQDHSFNKERGQSPHSLQVTGNNTPDLSNLPVKDSTLSLSNLSDEKRRSLAQIFSYGTIPGMEDDENEISSPLDKSMNFSFSGIGQTSASVESDDDEIQSVISDSCVPVGKYHVRPSAASILQSIIDKHGDIAVNCHLQSVSMRAYYLECLCSVVQELQSTPMTQLTKGKVKEMLAVLKDVEFAKIDVTWLRSILNQVSGDIELLNQHRTLETAKEQCNLVLESTKKELESRLEDLAEKEQGFNEAKALMEETKARLDKLQLESLQLNNTLTSVKSKVETYKGKSAGDGLL